MNASWLSHTAPLSEEDRAMLVLEMMNTSGTKIFFHEEMGGPVFELQDGQRRSLDDWGEWDFLIAQKFVDVDEGTGTAGPTWAGVKALRKWQRRHGR